MMKFTSTLHEISTYAGISNHWIAILLYGAMIFCLIYIRIVQLKMRKVKRVQQENRKSEIATLKSYIKQQEQVIAEIQEQYDALQDLIQSTQEQVNELKLNGRVDKEVLDLIYQATSSQEVPHAD